MDLNVIIELDGDRDSDTVIKEKMRTCRALGFNTIALAVYVKASDKLELPPPPDLKALTVPPGLRVYTRLTVQLSDSIVLYKLRKSKHCYDIIALEPLNSKVMAHMCSAGAAEFDILTFDLTSKLDYALLRVSLTNLEDRGVCAEFNYGPAQLGSSLRRNVILNGQNLYEKVTKNIILSSGVKDAFRLRNPLDAKAIAVLFLIPVNKCHAAVYTNGRSAIDSSKSRSQPAASAIEVLK